MEKRFDDANNANLIIQSEVMVDGLIFAFAYAKSFAVSLLVFLFLLYLRVGFPGTDAKSFFANVSSFSQEACDQDRTYFIGHTKNSLRKCCFSSCYWRCV